MLHDRIEQALFKQPFADRRTAFVDQLQKRHLIFIFGNNAQLLKCTVAQIHIPAVVDQFWPG